MRVPWPAGLFVLLPLVARAEVDIKSANGRLDLKATAAPLSEVLDRLAKQTGMKVTYDTPVRQPITVTLIGRTPAEAVLGVLDGLGLNYALRMDATGTRVEALIFAGIAGVAASPPATIAPPAPPSRLSPPPPPEPEDEAEAAEEAEDPEQPDKPAKPGMAPRIGQPGNAGPAAATAEAPRPGPPTFPGPGIPTAGPTFPVSPFGLTVPTAPNPFAQNPAPQPEPEPADSAADDETQ